MCVIILTWVMKNSVSVEYKLKQQPPPPRPYERQNTDHERQKYTTIKRIAILSYVHD